jgi:hypothetical protein
MPDYSASTAAALDDQLADLPPLPAEHDRMEAFLL